MDNQELVNELRKLLPPKVDYAKLVCADPFSYGCCFVWEDPEPYIIENAAKTIESQCTEIECLKSENLNLKKRIVFWNDDIGYTKLKQENEQLKAGREITEAQAQAIEFKAKKNAEAYNCIKKKNEHLQELMELAIKDIKSPSVCECCEWFCQGDEVCIDNGYMNFSWRGK